MYTDPEMMLVEARARQEALLRSARASRLIVARIGRWPVLARRARTPVPLSRVVREL